jgi:hypothetical protein
MFRVKNKDDEWVDELIRRADVAIEDYESYLLDKATSKDVAISMKRLREVIKNIKRSRENYSDPIQ